MFQLPKLLGLQVIAMCRILANSLQNMPQAHHKILCEYTVLLTAEDFLPVYGAADSKWFRAITTKAKDR